MLSEKTILGKLDSEPITTSDLLRTLKLSLGWQAVHDAFRDKLLERAYEHYGIVVSDQEVVGKMESYRKSRHIYTDGDTRAWLEANGLTDHDFAELIERDLKLARLKELLAADKIEERFALQKVVLSKVELYQLMVKDKDRATELMFLLNDGANFWGLCKEYTEDLSTRQQCGYLGVVLRSALRPEAEGIVFAAQEGETVGPVCSLGRFYLFHVERFYPALLDAETSKMLTEQIFAEWLEAQVHHSAIELFV